MQTGTYRAFAKDPETGERILLGTVELIPLPDNKLKGQNKIRIFRHKYHGKDSKTIKADEAPAEREQ